MFLALRGEHVLVHETAPEGSDASLMGMNDRYEDEKSHKHNDAAFRMSQDFFNDTVNGWCRIGHQPTLSLSNEQINDTMSYTITPECFKWIKFTYQLWKTSSGQRDLKSIY
jgi:hypothetical protein